MAVKEVIKKVKEKLKFRMLVPEKLNLFNKQEETSREKTYAIYPHCINVHLFSWYYLGSGLLDSQWY